MIKKYYEEQISNEQDVVGYFQTTPDYAELERNLVCKNMDLCLLSKIITQIDELFLLIIEKLYENRISATDCKLPVSQPPPTSLLRTPNSSPKGRAGIQGILLQLSQNP